MRIGVGCFMQETNSFSPILASLADFHVILGDEIINRAKSTNPEISGFHDVLSAEGYETVPLFAGRAMNRIEELQDELDEVTPCGASQGGWASQCPAPRTSWSNVCRRNRRL